MTEQPERGFQLVAAEDVARRYALEERGMTLEAGVLGRFLVQQRALQLLLQVLSYCFSQLQVSCHFLCLQTYRLLNSGSWSFL